MAALPRRRGWMGKGALTLAALVVAVTMLPAATAAQVRNLFEVDGVHVDETAANAAAAREQAITSGERKAFEMLLERITAPDDRARLPSPSQTAIEALIKDFWISEEKASTVRYLAVLNFNFRPSLVRDFLRRNAVAFTTQASPPAVIVPIYQTEQGPILWQQANPWLAAWTGETGTELRPLRVPDSSDTSLVSADQALVGDTTALSALAQRLGVGEAIVAIAAIPPPAQPDQPLELHVTLNRIDPDGKLSSTPITLGGRAGEDAASLLKRGVKESVAVLDAAWKGQKRTQPRPMAINAVDVPINDLRSWLAVRQRMNGIDAIDGVSIVLVARDRVRINLSYSSTPDDLTSALQTAGLTLTTGPGTWMLTLGAPPPPAQPSASPTTPIAAPDVPPSGT